jgi:hypothetical protein
MKSKSVRSKVIAGVVMGSMLISTSITAFANDVGGSNKAKSAVQQGKGNGFQTKLDALVSAGTITSSQETAIEKALIPQQGCGHKDFSKTGVTTRSAVTVTTGSAVTLKEGRDHKDFFENKLTELVKAGTITAADQTAIEAALTKANGNFKSVLDTLVKAGTLTSNKETAIEKALMPLQGQGRFNGGDHKDFFKNKLTELVKAGTITAADQTAIETALTKANGNFKSVLDSLVKAGTLTSSKETAIEKALMPPQGGEHKDFLKTKLDALVTAGTITADQETAVIKAFTPSK